MKILKKTLIIAALLIIVVMINDCAVNPVTGKRQLMLMSETQEIALGQQYDPEVIATFGEYQDSDLHKFMQDKCSEMGKISHRSNLEYHIKILDSPVVNAFAVPGGYIYMTRGILAQLNNEAELVGIIGHEMGHITARHSVSQQSKQQLGQLLLIGGILASQEFAKYADYALQSMQLLFLSFSRDNEREADRLGVEYSSKIGYDAHKMADFFQVLKKMELESEQAGVPTFLSTHPDPGDRYNNVNRDAAAWQESLEYDTWNVNAESYLRMIDGIVYGEDPRQGYTEGNTFYHPELKFKFPIPTGWQLENMPVQVRMAPQNGNALMVFTLSNQNTLENAAQKTIEDLQLTLQKSERTTVNGMPALVTLSNQVTQDQSTGQQQTIMVLSYFIEDNSNFYVFHGVSTEADFNGYIPVFESTMAHFDKLTDPSKINIEPQRILVKSVQHSGTLAEAFRYYGVSQNQMADFALLNNMELSDRVQSGKLIKIVGK